jgi:hypothetical protein
MLAIPMSWKARSILFLDAHLQKAFDEAQISFTQYQLGLNQECKYILSPPVFRMIAKNLQEGMPTGLPQLSPVCKRQDKDGKSDGSLVERVILRSLFPVPQHDWHIAHLRKPAYHVR